MRHGFFKCAAGKKKIPGREWMKTTALDVLILGASYGSLLATKILLAGHNAHMVCLPDEAKLFNTEGAIVRFPVRGREGLVEVSSKALAGKLSASGPADVDPSTFDLVVLAMQEPQYRAEGVRQLLDRVALARTPCMSIMNMPPLPYLARIPGLPAKELGGCFTDASVWRSFDPASMTLCSPDPQAFRPPAEKLNVLQVSLPSNFKAARFVSDADTAMLRRLEDDIMAARFEGPDGPMEIPVKLKVHDSVFVPFAKWAMLLAGNYRCVQKDGIRPIREAVHNNMTETKAVYQWVTALCVSLGASPDDLVPFAKYAEAAQSLGSPSSAARALAAGATNIERIDLLVQTIAAKRGLQLKAVDDIVDLVDGWLARNRAKAA
jgi:ketopantoate reductase